MALNLTWSDALRRGISEPEGFEELSHISDVMWRPDAQWYHNQSSSAHAVSYRH